MLEVSYESRARDFREKLQHEFSLRRVKNPRYSLRSYAKFLETSVSSLSDLINGKRSFTKKNIEKLGKSLGLLPEEVKFYQEIEIKKKSFPDLHFQEISLDQYSLMADWYHYAILELLKLNSFEFTPTKISEILNITEVESKNAIERLLRLGLVEYDLNGKIVDTTSGFSTNINNNLTSSAAKKLQEQILRQSIEALHHIPIEMRNHTSMTMAINPKLLPEAIKKISRFRRELCAFLETQEAPEEVYQFSISLFPITQLTKKN